MIWPIVTFGAAEPPPGEEGPQWVYMMRIRGHVVHPPRVRAGHKMILPGDLRSDDRAVGTWEGEAT